MSFSSSHLGGRDDKYGVENTYMFEDSYCYTIEAPPVCSHTCHSTELSVYEGAATHKPLEMCVTVSYAAAECVENTLIWLFAMT